MRLKNWSLVAVLLAGACATAFGAPDSTKATPPTGAPDTAKAAPIRKAKIDVPQTTFNFGYVPQNSSISHVFWVKSVGEDTLRITDVRPG
ncbi:MAG: hypothetical protein HZB43_10550 [candidate division Zixibacteria bacterium]|nr:hypothetical protein [candidate division Zixibacteria bacterium]